MIEHHIQKDILNRLISVPQARYADLKPADMDGNVFGYHLHQLIKQGFVKKLETGGYRLTALGKAAGINNKLSNTELYTQAHSILLLAVRDHEGQWLLRRRLVHPMYGRIGFLHAEPQANESLEATADNCLQRRTGLKGTFNILGGGFIRIFQNEEVESFTHFTLLTSSIEHMEPTPADHSGKNNWYDDADFSSDDFVPSMQDLTQKVREGKTFITELEYHLS